MVKCSMANFNLYDLTFDIYQPLSSSNGIKAKAWNEKKGFSSQRRLQYTCSDVHTVIVSKRKIINQNSDDSDELKKSIFRNGSTCTWCIEHELLLSLGTNIGSVYTFRGPRYQTTLDNFGNCLLSVEITSSLNEERKKADKSVWSHDNTIIADDLVGLVTVVHYWMPNIFHCYDKSSPLLSSNDTWSSSSDEMMNNKKNLKNNINETIFSQSRSPSPRLAMDSSKEHLLLVIGTSKGYLMIVEINLSLISNSNSNYRTIYKCTSMTTNAIDIIRSDEFNRLFIADCSGNLFLLTDVEQLLMTMANSNEPSTWPVPNILINLNGTRINQLDICSQYLVLSSKEHKVYLFHFERGHCFQIGAKSTNKCLTSSGKTVFQPGVCILAFQTSKNNQDQLIDWKNEQVLNDQQIKYKTFVSRPKCRLWEVGENGDIEYTHQYYQLVNQTNLDNSISVINGDKKNVFTSVGEKNKMINGFGHLYPMHVGFNQTTYLVTYSTNNSANYVYNQIYVINVEKQTIVAVTAPFKGCIKQLKCLSNEIFVTYYNYPCQTLEMFILILNFNQNESISLESIRSELPPEQQLSITNSDEHLMLNCNDLLINNDKQNGPEMNAMKQTDEKILFIYQQLESELNIQMKMPGTCLCSLPLENVLKNCNLNLMMNNENIFYLCNVLLSQQQLEKICSLALLNNHWPIYLNLLAINEKYQSKFFFYISLLNDCPAIILKQIQKFNVDQCIWLQVLNQIDQHINANNNETSVATNLEHIMAGKCKLCKIKNEMNNNNYIMLWKFIEESILYPSLWHCSSKYILEELMVTVMSLLNCKKSWQGPIFSIKFYLLILRSFVMDYSITSRSAWLMKRFQPETICKKYNKSAMDINKMINNDANDNIDDIEENNLDQLINLLKQQPFLNSKQTNFCTKEQTISNKQCFVFRLRKMTCNYCHQSILYNNEGKKCSTFKLYRKCGHVFHIHCLGPSASQYCKLCYI